MRRDAAQNATKRSRLGAGHVLNACMRRCGCKVPATDDTAPYGKAWPSNTTIQLATRAAQLPAITAQLGACCTITKTNSSEPALNLIAAAREVNAYVSQFEVECMAAARGFGTLLGE